jgi:hypothetical protein
MKRKNSVKAILNTLLSEKGIQVPNFGNKGKDTPKLLLQTILLGLRNDFFV